ncbi:hypothetical protein CRG98_003060 [Punica granatum]|nr:hypothetical protein CRG98_003060 [Punica granatum]
MEESRGLGSFFLCIAAAVLGLLSSLACIPSELKRTKKEELKLDGKLCYLPESGAFKYGVGALIFLCVGQFIGNSGIVWTVCSRKKITGRLKDDKRPAIITTGLLVVSW